MSTIIGLLLGLTGGSGIGYLLIKKFAASSSQSTIEEANKTADLTVKEAQITAKRLTSEAETKSEGMVQKAELKNEQIKNQKIQEARDKFNSLRSEFDSQKSKHLLEMKPSPSFICHSLFKNGRSVC